MNYANYQYLIPNDSERASKDRRSRLNTFKVWATETDAHLDDPALLRKYSDYLRDDRKFVPNSVRSHIATVRARIEAMLKSGELKKYLLQAGVNEATFEASVGRIWSAINAEINIEDENVRSRQLNLDDHHVQALLNSFRLSTPAELRDAALISLMIVTGVREHEVCALNVDDLYRFQSGKPALHVPEGYGCTERLIPYRNNLWVLKVVEAWMQYAEIREGAVFKSFYKGGRTIRDNRLSPRAVESILANYPIIVDGKPVTLKPLDLRHAFTRHQYRLGTTIDVIRGWLGFRTKQPVYNYLGNASYYDEPAQLYSFDMTRLNPWKASIEERS